MPNPRQLALQIQINERASLKNFFVSKNMFKKWKLYMEFKDVDLNIYSNKEKSSKIYFKKRYKEFFLF